MTESDWRSRALCRGATHVFFPETQATNLQVKSAKEICERCPVQQPCLEYALPFGEHDTQGIWGGTSNKQRRLIRRKLKQQASTSEQDRVKVL